MKPWILFVAGRYFRTKRKIGRISVQALQVAGITVGVMALITVLGVMNGLQLGFIEDILEISSYHLRIDTGQKIPDDDILEKLGNLKEVKAAVPFREVQTLGRGMFEEYESILVRCVPKNTPELDTGLIEQLALSRGSFDLTEERSIILGHEYALEVGVQVGDTLSLLSLGSGFIRPDTVDFTVTGLFRSGYYDFDRSLAFVSLSDYGLLGSEEDATPLTVGVKLQDRFRDDRGIQKILETIDIAPEDVVSWRDYNRSFFGALRMEKIAMMFLVGLIFLVVGVNIFHSQRRAVYERQEEIGVLRSLGAGPSAIRLVFLFDGFFIGLTGAAMGLVLGLLTAQNVNLLFTAVEAAGNFVLRLGGALFSSSGGVDMLSPSYFYLIEVPVRVIYREVLAIFIFAVLSSGVAAYTASVRVSRIYPQEVLRYE